MMQALAEKYDVEIFCFFGEAGHDRGLIDATSSFGCKASLRQAILNAICFHDAEEMVIFLLDEFKDDNSKSYQLIDDKSHSKQREITP